MTSIGATGEALAGLGAEALATIASTTADLVLLLSPQGVIEEVTVVSDDLPSSLFAGWQGRPWLDTVTADSRPKVESLLGRGTGPRWRHVNHAAPPGPNLPFLYATARLGHSGRRLAFGRDLRGEAALQQRLIDVQQALERDYVKLRHVETRYRLLFELTEEAVLLVDAVSHKVADANPAARTLLGLPEGRTTGLTFPAGFDPAGLAALQVLLANVRATGRPDEVAVALAGGQRLRVAATLFRQDVNALLLVRLVPAELAKDDVVPGEDAAVLLRLVQLLPDAWVVTSPEGQIASVNAAFLDLAQLASDHQARGRSLDRWVGRPGAEAAALLATVRQHGTVRLFTTEMHGEFGTTAQVEVSGVAVADVGVGLAIRDVGRRPPALPQARRDLPRSVEQMLELVGSVPLKDLVRETTDVIERLCIEAALELTQDNRASAAELLGLSRQSLYVKLRRYGLGELGAELDA